MKCKNQNQGIRIRSLVFNYYNLKSVHFELKWACSVLGFEGLCSTPLTNVSLNAPRLWGYIFVRFQQITFKLGNLTNFKKLFSVVSTEFPQLVHVQQKLKKTVERSFAITASKYKKTGQYTTYFATKKE